MASDQSAITTVHGVLQAVRDFESRFGKHIGERSDFQLKLFVSGNSGRVTNVRLHDELNYPVDVKR